MLKELLQGRFMGHPLHPIFIHLTLGFWIVSFVFDVIYLINQNSIFSASSFYCMGFGLLSLILTIPTGFSEFLDIPSSTLPKKTAKWHLSLNLFLSILYGINFILRYRSGYYQLTLAPFILSLIGITLLSTSGYLGGILVYRYGIGRRPQTQEDTRKKIRRIA